MVDQDLIDSPAFALARARIVLALDVDTLDQAKAIATRTRPFVGMVKVGLELYLAEGPRAVAVLREAGFEVFLDLKLHDIPNTVERSARAVAALGARYLTVHTLGGETMIRAAVTGASQGASAGAEVPPVIVGVTVLTSDAVVTDREIALRAELAAHGGCGALVCAALDLAVTRRAAPGLLSIVPGIRPDGAPVYDQARTMTPKRAIEAGADLLVIGRPITRAPSPEEAAFEIARSLIETAS